MYGSLKSHQAWVPLPVAMTMVGGIDAGMTESASAMVVGSAFLLWASDRRSKSAQNPLMPAISSDAQRRDGAVIHSGQSNANVDVQATRHSSTNSAAAAMSRYQCDRLSGSVQSRT